MPEAFYKPLWIAHEITELAYWLSLKGQEDKYIQEVWGYVDDADDLLAQWDGKSVARPPAVLGSDDELDKAGTEKIALP